MRAERAAAHLHGMITPSRKPDQSVAFDGISMPRGGQEGRTCDLTGCPQEASALVAAPDGDLLLVCTGHEADLTAPTSTPAIDEPGPMRTRRVRPPRARARFSARHAWLALRLLLGVAMVVWGLVVAGNGGTVDGLVTGTLGALLVLVSVRPRRARF